MGQVLKRIKGMNPYAKAKVLEEFAKDVEDKLIRAKGRDEAANLVARLMENKDPRISALMVCKWVEWRYGKPKDSGDNTRGFAVQIINHIPRPGDPSGHDTSAPAVVTEYSDTAPAAKRLVINDQVSVADGDQEQGEEKAGD